MKKHILVISQYFYPEQFRINDICCEWIKRGYKVTVLTGIPNYPQGRFYEGYGYTEKRNEIWNDIEIIRIPLIPRGKNIAGLVLNYLSFPISGFFWNLFSKIKADYVFMFETSPMTQCMIGVWYAKKGKIPLYLYVQDLWPENVEIITGIHNKLIIGPIQAMVDYIYKSCTDIFVTSPSFVKAVCDRSVSENKVHYWPQYAEDFYVALEKCPVTEIPKDKNFKIIFTGNIGYAQGLNILPQTAQLLKEQKCDVKFYIVGDGRYKEELIKEISEYQVLEMFSLIDRQPAERIPELLAASDVAFISFMDTDLFTMTIPAKLQSYMACGMPIIAAAEGETKRIIDEAQCGYCVPLGNAQLLADGIIQMQKAGNATWKQMGENAKNYSRCNFDKTKLMDLMDNFLK